MKFGKVLQQSMQVSSSAWEANWVDYKALKHIIKDCAQIQKVEKLEGSKLVKTKIKPSAKEDNDSIRTSPDEMNFFRTLRSEIKKISDFFLKEQAAYVGRVQAIEQQALALQADPKPDTKTELMKSCVSLYKELLLLENFAVMNFCGISKIVKKHDKWTGYSTRNKFMRTILMKQPFATYMPLLQMIDRLEHIFMEATGSSIDQHDTSRRHGSSSSSSSATPQLHQTVSSSSTNNSNSSPSAHAATQPVATLPRSRSTSPTRQDGQRSPAPDEAVSLGRVHALRDDARHFRETEGYDGDDDGDSADDAAMQGAVSPQSESGDVAPAPSTTTAISQHESASFTQRHSIELPPVTKPAGIRKEYNSDSDAAAIAMLSMKEGGLAAAAGSTGFRSGSDSEGGSRFKRKACSPLTGSNGKRKMSFATILN